MLTTILMCMALACFAIGAFVNPPKVSLLHVGLAFWVLAEILGRR